uniref:Uncharacterized protein n=1 Tax=Peronospora matthiolae TaxID=2874970 RepID=A0AAV1UPJ4_9STRA
MLSQTKTISYDHVNKTTHFYFFTQTTAACHKAVRVPFFGRLYRLRNAHRLESGSVWQRKQGLNGLPYGRRVGYTVDLHSFTRFSDVGKLAAFLKEKSSTDFDMDTHTPDSRTSTI